MARNISKNTEKKSVRSVVRTRRAGTPVEDYSTPSDERTYIDVEIDDSGNRVTDMTGQGT